MTSRFQRLPANVRALFVAIQTLGFDVNEVPDTANKEVLALNYGCLCLGFQATKCSSILGPELKVHRLVSESTHFGILVDVSPV